jgi:hypothetical protein
MQARVPGALRGRIVDIQQPARTTLDEDRIHTDVRRPVEHRAVGRVPDVGCHRERAVTEGPVLDRLHLELDPGGPLRGQVGAGRVLVNLDGWGRRRLTGARTSAALGRPDQAPSTDQHADQSSGRTSPKVHSLIHDRLPSGPSLASRLLPDLISGCAASHRPAQATRTPAPPRPHVTQSGKPTGRCDGRLLPRRSNRQTSRSGSGQPRSKPDAGPATCPRARLVPVPLPGSQAMTRKPCRPRSRPCERGPPPATGTRRCPPSPSAGGGRTHPLPGDSLDALFLSVVRLPR